MRVEAVSRGDTALVLERETELAGVDAFLADLISGSSRVLAVEGPGGIGKTTLLAEARAAGRAAGGRVVSAVASELERGFAFGVARQWFEPVLRAADPDERAELLTGTAASAARVLFDTPPCRPDESPTEPSAEAGQRALYGLYWLSVALAESQPLLLVVDDAQWADEASLRLLNFLAGRLDGLPISLLIACRPPDSSDAGLLLARLLADPGCAVMRPLPLSAEAAATIIAGRLLRAPEPRFLAACHRTTGGNPYFVRQLAAALHYEDLAPTDDHAERVAHLTPPDVSRGILTRLSPAARRLAQALAVLGTPSEASVSAAVAGLDADVVTPATAELTRAGLILDKRPLRFEHPIVHAALLGSLTIPDRSALHAAAGRELRRRGAGPELVAIHVLESEPGSDPDAFVTLRDAAALAMTRGAPEVAGRLLRRALVEAPADADERAEALLALSTAENEAGQPGAVEHSRQAVELAHDPVLRARAALALGWSSGPSRPPGAFVGLLDEAAGDVRARDRELALALDAMALMILFLGGERAEMGRRVDALRTLGGTTPGEAALLAAAARYDLDTGAPAAQVHATIRGALNCPDALRVHGPHSSWLLNSAVTLNHLERFGDNEVLLERAIAMARDRGSASGFAIAATHRAKVWLLRGDLRRAEALAQQALDSQAAGAWYHRAVAAVLMHVLIERGRLDAARAVYDDTGIGEVMPYARAATPLLIARGELRYRLGDKPRALADLREARARIDHYADANVVGLDARVSIVAIHHELSEIDEARLAADAAVDVARAWGTPGWLGQALRAQGLVNGGERGIALLRESVDVLGESEMQLEHARALIDLGAALRRDGARAESREPLRGGLAAAERGGAEPLADRARQELAASGVTVRRTSHGDRLTPSEQRIAEMAASGSSNPQIAQAFFVTVKTVESHLAGAYRKLGISSRRELPASLAKLERE